MSHAKVPPIKPEEYERLWVWLDYWSVPQSAQRADERSAAIDSIPAYALAASFILVLCPTVVHRDTGATCNFASWERRGWCRLERLAFSLARYSVTSPPYVYVVREPAKIERYRNSKFHKPSQSVFCGEFTVMDDRVRLLPVVQSLIDHGCQARKLQGDVAAWRKLLAMKCARSESSSAEMLRDHCTRYGHAIRGDLASLSRGPRLTISAWGMPQANVVVWLLWRRGMRHAVCITLRRGLPRQV